MPTTTSPTDGRRGRILLLSDVESLLARSAQTLRSDVARGRLPRPRQLGATVFWLAEDLLGALAACPPANRWPGPETASHLTEAGAA